MNSPYSNRGEDRKPDLVSTFWAAPDQAFFDQKTIAAVLCCSESKMERDRWAGGGIPYYKIDRRCLYRKADVVKWVEAHASAFSASAQ